MLKVKQFMLKMNSIKDGAFKMQEEWQGSLKPHFNQKYKNENQQVKGVVLTEGIPWRNYLHGDYSFNVP